MNGKVKTNYSAHENLFLSVTKGLIVEQALEFFGMEDAGGQPTANTLPTHLNDLHPQEQNVEVRKVLLKFLRHYGYCSFSLESAPDTENEEEVVSIENPLGGTTEVVLIKPSVDDAVLNYSTNLCHWGLHLLNMNDTTKEGDIDRVVNNSKHMVPFFYSHSNYSHYLTENINFVLQVCNTLSPRDSLRVREGSFVNCKGGKGNNMEADLKQEHSVRNRKDLIRHLGANKTEHAMKTVTEAADTIDGIVRSINKQLGVKDRSGRHPKKSTAEDMAKLATVLRQVRPFQERPGRRCNGFNNIKRSPLLKINRTKMQVDIERKIERLLDGLPIETEEDSDDDDEIDG